MNDTSIETSQPRVSSHVGSSGSDNPPKAIGIILLALFCFSCSDAASKALTATLAPIQIIWMRYFLFTVLIVPLGLAIKGPGVFRSKRFNWQFVRAVGTYGSAILFTTALQFLPLAESMAMNFVAPIFVTALSILLLGENVGIRRWLALIVGLIGVLIVIRPGTDAFHPAAIFPIAAAASWAFGMIATRKTSFADDAWTALTYAAIIGLAISTLIVPFVWRTPTLHELALSSVNGGMSTIAQLLVILAYRLAPASVLAPFSYSQLVWATIFGYVIFSEVPDQWTVVGAMIVIASGLYIAHRERIRARETRRKILSGQ